MLKIASIAIAVALVWADAATGATSRAEHSSRASACVVEAQSSHDWAWRMEPSLRPMIDAQRKAMSEICTKLSAARGFEAEELLAQCLREAAAGPRHIQRGRDMDREHIERQRTACRAVAGTK